MDITKLLFPIAVLFVYATPSVPGPSFTADYYEVSYLHPERGEIDGGKRIVQGRYFRDREGRLRQEDWWVANDGTVSHRRVFIADPVADMKYELLSDSRTALSSRLSASRTPARSPLPGGPLPAGNPPQETDLGRQTIEGFACEGRKVCSSTTGTCTETWFSPDLQYLVKIQTTYASGVIEHKTWFNFKMNVDNDPTLFRVPPDYVVKERPSRPAAPLAGTPAKRHKEF